MKINEQKQEPYIYCGNAAEGFENLIKLCEKEAEKLLKTIDFSAQATVSVVFWTASLPAELICRCYFYKDESGLSHYDLDTTESTL